MEILSDMMEKTMGDAILNKNIRNLSARMEIALPLETYLF